MEKSVYALFNKVRQNWCNTCDSGGDCKGCMVSELLNDIKYLDVGAAEASEGCSYCWDDRRKKSKEIFYFDSANNMRVSEYCPACGRKY